MINEVRTLLANLDGQGPPTGEGEEYTPPAFKAPVLPDHVLAVRVALFGADPDRRKINYRVRQLMVLVHATELAEFVTASDPRLTYLPFDPGFAFTVGTGYSSTGTSGPIYLQGHPPPETAGGKLYRAWRLTYAAGALTTVILAPATLYAYETTPLVYTDGLSQPVPLPGSGLAVKIPQAGRTDGDAWTVESFAAPAEDPAAVADKVATVGEEALTRLFGLSPAEPYLTWRNLWRSSKSLAHRLGAVALAVAARTKEAGGF